MTRKAKDRYIWDRDVYEGRVYELSYEIVDLNDKKDCWIMYVSFTCHIVVETPQLMYLIHHRIQSTAEKESSNVGWDFGNVPRGCYVLRRHNGFSQANCITHPFRDEVERCHGPMVAPHGATRNHASVHHEHFLNFETESDPYMRWVYLLSI